MPALPLYQGTANDGRDPFDLLPQNALINAKPGAEHLEMMHGIKKLADSFGKSRGGVFCQTDLIRGEHRVMGKYLVLNENGKLTQLNKHKIPVFEIDARADKTAIKVGDTATMTVKYSQGEGEKQTVFSSGALPDGVVVTQTLDTDTEDRFQVTSSKIGAVKIKFTSSDLNNEIEYEFDFNFQDSDPAEPLPVSLNRKTEAREEDVFIEGDGFAKLVPTNNNIAITTNREQYLYNQELGLRKNTAKFIGEPIDTCFMNERLIDITIDSENKTAYVAQHVAGKDFTIKPLASGKSDAEPDEIIGIERNTGNYLYIFNRFTIEIFIDAGGETETNQYTLRRQQQSEIQGGLSATNLKVNVGGTYCLIGGKKAEPIAFHVIEGGRLRMISNADINMKLAAYSQAQLDASWLEYIQLGAHKLIVCQLPDQTIIHDLATGGWATFTSSTGFTPKTPWRASHVIYNHDYGSHTVGDKSLDVIGKLDKSTFQQYEENQEFIAYTPGYDFGRRGTRFNSLYLETITGDYDRDYTQRLYITESIQKLKDFGNEREYEVANYLEYDRIFLQRQLGHRRGKTSFRLRLVGPYRSSIGQALMINEEP